MRRLAIVGASLAGVRAAEGARAHGWTGEIVMIGDEVHAPYDRPPLSKAVLNSDDLPEPQRLRSTQTWDALGIDLRTGCAATGIGIGDRVLRTDHGDVDYDALVIATGSTPRVLRDPTSGLDVGTLDNARHLRTYDDAIRVRTTLDSVRQLVVFGAGFIGAEIASAAVSRGTDVTIVNASHRPLARCTGPLAAAALVELHRSAGVRTVLGTEITQMDMQDNVIRSVSLTSGERLETDAVIVAVGSTPTTDWLGGAEIDLDPAGRGVRCGRDMSTSASGVFAAGDVASLAGHPAGHWTTAVDTGYIAGANAAGAQEIYSGVPFAWSTWYGHRIQMVGRTGSTAEDSIEEIAVDDGYFEYRDGSEVVGAVGIDSPGQIARLRRHLATQVRTKVPTFG
ncbi:MULTISPECIES: NAD(P)/FAD-dependent oxidoreductase [unclassified Gordonia (in: high G+C Gram-positive bacteria)]|uniref:NAD(P)/FAD-dependent oxidoreductase n=1 Tax=unclassified Gordonia (in: high G+C Gram-positive bacteria) TaxID=2657482 RepID=UPI001F10F0EC|nr:FAD-dependent oxidoreductase [Gordonia sp. ABSL49_1]MCH5644743.1 FAD-dependent oxidoreductase [Gordonia sp. ABSL49_1]